MKKEMLIKKSVFVFLILVLVIGIIRTPVSETSSEEGFLSNLFSLDGLKTLLGIGDVPEDVVGAYGFFPDCIDAGLTKNCCGDATCDLPNGENCHNCYLDCPFIGEGCEEISDETPTEEPQEPTEPSEEPTTPVKLEDLVTQEESCYPKTTSCDCKTKEQWDDINLDGVLPTTVFNRNFLGTFLGGVSELFGNIMALMITRDGESSDENEIICYKTLDDCNGETTTEETCQNPETYKENECDQNKGCGQCNECDYNNGQAEKREPEILERSGQNHITYVYEVRVPEGQTYSGEFHPNQRTHEDYNDKGLGFEVTRVVTDRWVNGRRVDSKEPISVSKEIKEGDDAIYIEVKEQNTVYGDKKQETFDPYYYGVKIIINTKGLCQPIAGDKEETCETKDEQIGICKNGDCEPTKDQCFIRYIGQEPETDYRNLPMSQCKFWDEIEKLEGEDFWSKHTVTEGEFLGPQYILYQDGKPIFHTNDKEKLKEKMGELKCEIPKPPVVEEPVEETPEKPVKPPVVVEPEPLIGTEVNPGGTDPLGEEVNPPEPKPFGSLNFSTAPDKLS